MLMPVQVNFNSQFQLPRKGISSEEFPPIHSAWPPGMSVRDGLDCLLRWEDPP